MKRIGQTICKRCQHVVVHSPWCPLGRSLITQQLVRQQIRAMPKTNDKK